MEGTPAEEVVEASSSSPRHSDSFEDHTSPATSFTFVMNNPSRLPVASIENVSQHDRFAHTRTKRKRTSPQDFATLEREYEREPKPDRAARAEIASRVALNEKEVQIWFQNRRQMTRRKARTWQPNEISEIIRSSQHTSGSASPPASQPNSSQDQSSSQESTDDKPEESVNERPGQGIFANTSIKSFDGTSRDEIDTQEIETVLAETSNKMAEGEEKGMNEDVGSADGAATELPSLSASSDDGIEVVHTQTVPVHVNDGPPTTSQKSSRPLKRSSSNMRLRVSLDGKAALVADSSSPSPPSKNTRRQSWPARGPLQRSQSAITPSTPSLDQIATDVSNDIPSSQPSPQPWTGAGAMGRSRDARTWEFYCDSDPRDTLSIAAEHDRRGTAQGAISLLRSGSGSAKHRAPGFPLLPSLRKQNSNVRRSIEASQGKTSGKRKSLDDLKHDRPKLARTSSSVARLQTVKPKTLMPMPAPTATMMPSSQPTASTGKKGKTMDIYEDPNGDSDKENWQPGTRVSGPTHPRRQPTGAVRKPVLGENMTELSHGSSLGALMESSNVSNIRRKQRSTRMSPTKENVSNTRAVDNEVAAFMGETSAQDEDLDAVQNLMSLSKSGRW